MSDHLERFDRAFHRKSIDEILQNRRAIVGPANMPTDAQGQLAKAGLDALKAGKEPSPTQLAALEMIVRLMRPSLLSVDRQIEDLPPESAYLGDWDAFRETIRSSLYTIGRVDTSTGDSIGTGFLVSSTLLVTNIHVLDDLTGGIRQLERGQAQVRFKREFGAIPEEPPVEILSVVKVHDSLDLALLEVAPVPLDEDRTLLTLSADSPAIGDSVVAIGYPLNDTARNPLFIPSIFGSRFGVKRVAPGAITHQSATALFHDCSTLGGNSGSPVVSLATGRIVGVHCSGNFMFRNQSVRGTDLQPFIQPHL